ncbi:MAG: hypothetical protein J5966_05125 [Lachnospiraceae bacterium]|nr:hypothetical protein [Lachnospiraceae bacterium]
MGYKKADKTLYERNFEGYEVPEKLKNMAITIMKRFTLTGICDGMYICNIIANQNMMSNGAGKFNGEDHVIGSDTKRFLTAAYSCNIREDSTDQDDLDEILRTGTLNSHRMYEGIRKQIKQIREEKRSCDIFRKEYCDNKLIFAKMNLAEI